MILQTASSILFLPPADTTTGDNALVVAAARSRSLCICWRSCRSQFLLRWYLHSHVFFWLNSSRVIVSPFFQFHAARQRANIAIFPLAYRAKMFAGVFIN
jgi:hypothetical protein